MADNEKVVSLKLDNSDFENNAKKSTSTLQKLEQAMSFKGSDKGLEAFQKTLNGLDFDRIMTSLDAVQKKFSFWGTVGDQIIRNFTNRAVNTIVGGITKVTNQFKNGGMTRALNMENANFMFAGMGMNVEKAMASANEAVKGTAYGLDEAAKAAAQFGASGVKAGDEMTKALRAISGVAAMTNSDYGSIADIFTTIAGQGKVMAEQLNQLSARGLNAAAALATYLHTSEANVRDMVHDGKINFTIFYKAMDEAFGAHAKQANQTFSGSLANMKAAVNRIGADFITPILHAARDLFNNITPMIDGFRATLKPFIPTFTSMVDTLGSAVVPVAKTLADVLTKISSIFVNILTSLKNSGKFEGFFSSLFTVFQGILKVVGSIFEIIKPLFSILESVFSGLGSSLNSGLANGFETLATTIHDFIIALTPGPGLLSLITSISRLAGSVFNTLAKVLNIVAQVILIVLKVLSPFIDALSYLISIPVNIASSIIDMINSMVPLEKILKSISTAIDWVKDAFVGANPAITTGNKTIADFQKVLRDALAFFGNVTKKIKDFLDNIIKASGFISSGFQKSFTSGFANIKKVLIDTYDGIFTYLKTLFPKLSSNLETLRISINNLFNNLQSWVANAIGKLTGHTSKQIEKSQKTTQSALDRIKQYWDDFSNKISAIWDAIIVRLTGFYNRFLTRMKSNGAQIQNGTHTLADKMADGFDAAGKKLSNFFSQVDSWLRHINWGNFLTDLESLSRTLVNLAKVDVLLKIAKSIKKFGEIADAAKEVLNKFGEVFESFAKRIGKGVRAAEPNKMMQLAKAIGILTAAIYVLGHMKMDDIVQGIATLAGAMAMFRVAMGSLVKLASTVKPGKFNALSGSFIPFAAAITLLAVAMKIFSGVDWGGVVKGSVAMLALSANMIVLSYASDSVDSAGMQQLSKSMKSFANSLIVLALAFKILSSIDWGGIVKGLTVMSAMAASISALAFVSNLLDPDNLKQLGKSMNSFANSLIILGIAFKIISSIDWGGITKGSAVMLIMVASISALGFVSNFMKSKNFNSVGKSLISFGTALVILAAAFKIISSIDWGGIAKGIVVLAAFVAAIGVLSFIINSIKFKGTGSFLALSVGLIGVAVAMKILASIPLSGIGVALLGLGGAIAIIAAGCAILMPLRPALYALSAFVLSIGASILAIGLGVLAFATALGIAAAALVPFGIAFVSFIKMLDSNRDVIGGSGARLIMALLDAMLAALAANATFIGAMGGIIIAGLLNGIAQSISGIVTSAVNVIVAFINALGDNINRIIDAGINFMMKLLEGIARGVGKIVANIPQLCSTIGDAFADGFRSGGGAANWGGLADWAGTLFGKFKDAIKHVADNIGNWFQGVWSNIKTAFTDGINAVRSAPGRLANAIGDGLRDGINRVKNAVGGWVSGIGNGISNALNALKSGVMDAGSAIGNAIGTGIRNGIQACKNIIDNAIKFLINLIPWPIRKALKINSPSKVMYEIGQFVVMGLANGITENADMVGNAMKTMGNAMGRMYKKNDWSKIADVKPTITPVVDLTEAKRSASMLSSIFGNQNVSLSTSMANGLINSPNRVNDIAKASTINYGPTITYNQTNNSPKPLNDLEIYRQTRNQLSQLRMG